MPSFDIVSKVDMQEVDNAVNSALREINQRYDFKGSNCSIELNEEEIKVLADDQYKLDQIQIMLKTHFVKRNIDSNALDFGKSEMASGNSVRQVIKIKQGVDSDSAKKIVKLIKATKMKVQSSIRGEEVRVEGKKLDDLQECMSYVKEQKLDFPVQFINFRS